MKAELIPHWDYTNASLFDETNNRQGISTQDTYTQELMDKWNQVQYVLSPTLVVVGLVGNLFSFLTVSRHQFRKLTTRRILCVLAVSDSLLLCTNPFNQNFMLDLWGQDVRALSTFGCKLFFVLYRLGKISASWFIVLITIERFLAVIYPLKVKTWMTKRVVLVSIVAVYVMSLAVAASWSFSTGIKDGVCIPDLADEDSLAMHKAFVIFGACMYSIVPIVIMVILTPPVIVRIIKSHRRRKKLAQTSLERSTRETSKASVMLIAITLEYIILVTPITIVLISTFWTNTPIFGSTDPRHVVLQALALILEQLNNSINFFVYILCSQQFRKRFRDLVCCRKPVRQMTIRSRSPSSTTLQHQRFSIQSTQV